MLNKYTLTAQITLNLRNIMEELAKNNIASLLVEGGQQIYTSFVRENIFDDILVFIGPKLLGDGLSIVNSLGVPSIKRPVKLKLTSIEKIGDDALLFLTK